MKKKFAYGQLASIFGEKALELDIFIRSLNFEELADNYLKKINNKF